MLDRSLTPRISSSVVSREEDGFLLAFHMGTGTIEKVNDTGEIIWRLCDGAHSVGDICSALQQLYPAVEYAVISRDLEDFLLDVIRKGFVEGDTNVSDDS